jgi:solute carrier family 25 carnitine/acylcarnitine transporter 20/29
MQTAKTPMTNWQCIKQVYHQNGLQGLYRGFIPTAKREMVGNTVYFLAYETAKKTLIERFVENDKSLTPEAATKRSYQCIGLSGGFAGFAYWLVVFPVDTVKSVMQADRLHDPRYSGVLDCCRQLYVEGNISRFYRGISPSLLRAFSANAVTFVAFESCYSFLHEIWT